MTNWTRYFCPGLCSSDLPGRLIQPHCPTDSPILMIVGEAPGEDEDRQGRPFVGKTGQEMDNYLKRVGIPRERCYVTNLVKCRPPGNRDPRVGEVEACSVILLQELFDVRPRFVAAVGRFSTRFFLGDVNMEMVHGIPHRIEDPWPCIVIPVYHPALGLHETTNMSLIMSDFIAVKDTMMGKLVVRDLGKHVEPPPYHLLEPGEDPRPFMDDLVAVDTEAVDEHDNPWCLQFSSGDTGHIIMADNLSSLLLFGEHVADPDVTTIIHNTLYDFKPLRLMGVLPAKAIDTMIMAYLLQTEPQGLKPLTFRHLGVRMNEYDDVVGPYTQIMALEYLMQVAEVTWPKLPPVLEIKAGQAKVRQPQTVNQRIKRIFSDMAKDKEVDLFKRWYDLPLSDGRSMVEERFGRMRKAFLKDVDRDEALQYAGTDPWATYHIYPILKKKVDAIGLNEALDRDIRVVPMVEVMQSTGMPVSPPYFRALKSEFSIEMDQLGSDIYALVGDVHPGSDVQVLKMLGDLGLANIKYKKAADGKMIMVRKKTTDIEALTLLKDKHPVIPLIMRWKVLSKLVDAFINVLLEKADEDNRVRSTIRITRVITGRLATSNPNLMAIPVRTEDGRKIRGGFQAPPGFKLVSGDQSQVEMRVIAHLSQDPAMLDIFQTGKDIHSFTASRMFGKPVEELDEMLHRYPAKRVGFGVLNLISAGKLLREMTLGGAKGWTEERCQKLITDWFGIYHGVADYVEERKAEARRTGMVRDLAGRMRLIPEIMSVHRRIREEGVRYSVNAPIQMGAQAIEKEAMYQCRWIYEEAFPNGEVIPLNQIHDDVIWQIREDLVDVVIPLIKESMEHCMDDRLSVPLKVDFKVGDDWEHMSKYKVGT